MSGSKQYLAGQGNRWNHPTDSSETYFPPRSVGGYPIYSHSSYNGSPLNKQDKDHTDACRKYYDGYIPPKKSRRIFAQRTIIPKDDQEPVTIHNHNGRARLVSTSPVINTIKDHRQKTFDNWATQEHGGLAEQVEFMSGGKKAANGEDSAAELYLDFFRRKFPKTFDSFIEENGLKTKSERMNAVQTAAVMTDVGMSQKQLEKLQKHIKHHTGTPLFCPRDDLKTFTDDCPEAEVFSEKITHKDGSVKKIHILMHDIESYLCAEMDRELEATYKSYKRSCSRPLFGYSLLESQIREGIYTLLGTDHGQEFCQFVIRLLLGNPEDCRLSGSSDYQTKTINFCTVKCRKDSSEIFDYTKENVGKALRTLRTKQMVGIEDKHGRVKTLFIAKGLKLMSAERDTTDADSCILNCDENGCEIKIKVKAFGLNKNGPLNPFQVIQNFHNFQCGDYAAQFCLQGRPGMSSCRCMHCNLSHWEWNNMDRCTTTQRILTYDDIKDGDNADVGNLKIPTYEYDPLDCLSGILHGEIGSGNSQIDSSLIPLLINVDSATKQEYELLLEDHNLQVEILDIGRKLQEREKLSNDEELKMKKCKRSDLKKKKRGVKTRLLRAQRSSKMDKVERIQQSLEEIRILDEKLKEVENEVAKLEECQKEDILMLRNEKTALKEKRKAVVAKIDQLETARNRRGGSLISSFHDILTKHRIVVKAWHGGSLTGKHVIRLLRKSREVLMEVREICLERIKEREDNKEESEQRPIPSREYVVGELKRHEELFKIQDYAYLALRIIHPTDEEYDMTECFIDEFKKKWIGMGLSTTCKMHFNFDHVCDQQRRIKGFGDKCKDWLEREHQNQIKYNRMTFGMMPQAALKLQAKLKWRANNPQIREQITRVHASFNKELKEHDELSIIELEEMANRINKGWKEKYGSKRKLKRKLVDIEGAQR